MKVVLYVAGILTWQPARATGTDRQEAPDAWFDAAALWHLGIRHVGDQANSVDLQLL